MRKTSTDTPEGRYYGDLPSVTTIISVLEKAFLPRWYAKKAGEVAIAAIQAHRTSAEVIKDLAERHRILVPKASMSNPERARRYLSAAAERYTQERRDFGSAIHDATETLHRGETPVAPEGMDAKAFMATVAQYQRAMNEYGIKIIHKELEVRNRMVGYGGRFDEIITVPQPPYPASPGSGFFLALNDIKTGAIYDTVALQLVAYIHAETMILPDGTEVPMPRVDRATVLHVDPDGYEFVQIIPSPLHWFAFQAATELWHWRKGLQDAPWHESVPGRPAPSRIITV